MAAAQRKKNKSTLSITTIFTGVGIIIILVVGGLYWLKSSSSTTMEKTSPKSEVVNPLPPPPEEKWSYIKALESRTVNGGVVTEPSLPKSSPTSSVDIINSKPTTSSTNQSQDVWSVLDQPQISKPTSQKVTTKGGDFGLQCGAFDNAKSAEKRKAELVMLGQNAYVKQGGNWFRVYIGPLGNRSQAEQVRDSLNSKVDCFVLGM